jgi:hypothetical protein
MMGYVTSEGAAPSAAPAAPSGSAVQGVRGRGTRTPRDMAISLLVLLIPVFLIVVIYRALHGGSEPVVVDPAPAVAEARAANVFPVAEPTGLAKGWRSVSAIFTRGEDGPVLRIGYVTPHDNGVQVVESTGSADQLLSTELTSGAQAKGAVDVAGQRWQHYLTRPGAQALVLLQPDRTIILTGSGTDTELRDLAGSVSR